MENIILPDGDDPTISNPSSAQRLNLRNRLVHAQIKQPEIQDDNSISLPISKVIAKSWYANYMDSPMYKKRLANFGINTIPDTQPVLNTNIMNQNHRTSFALSKEQSNHRIDMGDRAIEGIPYKENVPNINIDKSQIDDAKEFYKATLTPEQILAHELSHISRTLSPKEMSFINSLNKVNPIGSPDHDNKPNEIKADLDALRYHMWKKGIYDTRKRDMTIYDYNNIIKDKDIKNSLEFKRLSDKLSAKDIIELNNKIASINHPDSLSNMV